MPERAQLAVVVAHRYLRRISLTLLTAVLTLQSFASPVRLTLRLNPVAELPGIPVTLHVEVENPSAAVALVPNSVAMQVTPKVENHSRPWLLFVVRRA